MIVMLKFHHVHSGKCNDGTLNHSTDQFNWPCVVPDVSGTIDSVWMADSSLIVWLRMHATKMLSDWQCLHVWLGLGG